MNKENYIFWIDNSEKRILFEGVIEREYQLPNVGSFEDFSEEGQEPDPYIIVNIEKRDGGDIAVFLEKTVTFKPN